MASGQPVSQNHTNPHSLSTDLSFPWDTFALADNKQMPGNDEASATERTQRAAAMIPKNNIPRQAATTPNTSTTPISNDPVYPSAGGLNWPVQLSNNQFQAYTQQEYSLPHQHALQNQGQIQPPSQFNQQQLGRQQQYAHPSTTHVSPYPNTPYPNTPYPSNYTPQAQMSSVGYAPMTQPADPAVLDPSLFQGHSRNSSGPSTSETARRPPKVPKHGRKSSKQGPTLDRTNRVQKTPQRSPVSAHSRCLNISSMPGDINRRLHFWMADKALFPDGQEPTLPWPDLVEFVKSSEATIIKSESMSRDPSAIERVPRGVSSIQDELGLSPDEIQAERREIARLFRGYQKEFRPKESQNEFKFKCTLGCPWSHETKSNWERHERTHYPQEIWICCHDDCLDKSSRTRVSFRKDLARRHHTDHHQRQGDPDLTNRQLDELKIRVTDSLFPRGCVFHACQKTFTSFDERSVHMENHLKSSDALRRDLIRRYYSNDSVQAESDHDGEHDVDDPRPGLHGSNRGITEPYDDDEDDDDEDDDDDDDTEAGTGGIGTKHHNNDRDDGTGAGGTGSNQWGTFGGASGPGYYNTTTYQQQDHSPMSTNTPGYNYACNFDTFGGSGHIPAIDKRPWKTTTSLRLQLLPQVFARGIAQTPIVLKKIQLQAALMLDLSSVKKTQIINILRREIAMMAGALPVSSGPSIKRFPHLTAMTKLLPGLTKTASRFDMSCIAKQNQAILKFAGFRKDLLSQELEDPGGEDHGEPADPLHDRLTHFEGGHIYRCLPIRSSMTPIRPSRLVHVGTKNKPILHLDTSEVLPSHVDYCSLSHCWDDGYGLCLSKGNVTSLRQSIPADGLTQTFHVAINIARERGLEYLWIDTLCIIQDSDEDIQAEVPRITQIHASAMFAIVITSVAYDGEAQQCDESASDDNVDFDEKSEEQSIPETPGLTLDDTIETKPSQSNGVIQKEDVPVEIVRQVPERRGSHQLEVCLWHGG